VPELDLTFLGTGDEQHVFVETAAAGGAWFYKIPAAFGFILPLNHPRRPRPRASPWRWLVRAPGGTRLLAVRARANNRRAYARMLDVVDYMDAVGVGDVLLPCRALRDARAVLRVDGTAARYRGPMLVQRRADAFFDRIAGSLSRYDWCQFVDLQHRLWRHGVGFWYAREALGPRSWALLDGRLCLGDTGALTTDYAQAYAALEPAALEVRVRRQIEKSQPADRAAEYFAFVRRGVNRDQLRRLWRTGLSARDAGAAAAPVGRAS
jgi:hypothetical protein